jgi:probable phosphoglycerate mutase
MHLYLIRHGESYVNLADWAHGYSDVGLTELGQQQAAALAAWSSYHIPAIDILYTSTLQRAHETAAYLAQAYKCPIQEDDRLREIGTNKLDHTPWPGDNLPSLSTDFWGTEIPFARLTPTADQGESWMHFRIRVGAFVEETVERHRGQVVVVVCHGGVLDVIFDHIFNVGPWRRCEVWTSNTGITHFEYMGHPGREAWRLHYYNRLDHLHWKD